MREPSSAVPRLGPLEQEVMDILWDCPDELCTRDVLRHLTSHTLAYTTVATVLTNLVKKAMVERIAVDRTWAYRPLQSRSRYAAGIMSQALTASQDRAASFLHFVQNMSDDDSALLRGLLATPADKDLPDPAGPPNPPLT